MERKKKHEELKQEASNFITSIKTDKPELFRNERVVEVEFNDIISYSTNLGDGLLDLPDETIEIFETVIEEQGLIKNPRFRVKNIPKNSIIPIRHLRSKHLDKFISINGIIRQATDTRPKCVNARFECPNCGSVLSILQEESKIQEPKRCACGWKGEFKILSKEMVDQQRIVLEESPEDLESVGAQPQKINALLREDLTDQKFEKKVIPGTKVNICGVLRELYMDHRNPLNNQYEIYIDANSLTTTEEDFDNIEITQEDISEFNDLAIKPEVLELLAHGLAPSVYGYDEIKKGIILQLFGGVRKKKSDNTYTRGSVHQLLIGDASTAKSVLLKNAVNLIPRARFVSGKSASGAGLTGAVVHDKITGQWMLEAGAMVLANKSLLATDELDKMGENDRQNMHEAMEAQTVSFSKATIQTQLNTQTSLLAAANPKLGKFEKVVDGEFNLLKEVNLSIPLLSRFDLIWILRDEVNLDKDEKIAERILSEHSDIDVQKQLSHEFIKKYIVYSKKIEPKLTKECAKEIKDFYVSFRQAGKKADAIQLVARQLEGIVRLTEAHARMRLSPITELVDVRMAISIVKEALKQVGLRSDGFIDNTLSTGITHSARQKVLLVREAIEALTSLNGKVVGFKDLEEFLKDKLTKSDIDTAIETLSRNGDIFSPKGGYYQKL